MLSRAESGPERELGGPTLIAASSPMMCARYDLLVSNDPKYDSAYFEDLLRLELALCDQEPFVRIGGMYQLIGTKP